MKISPLIHYSFYSYLFKLQGHFGIPTSLGKAEGGLSFALEGENFDQRDKQKGCLG